AKGQNSGAQLRSEETSETKFKKRCMETGRGATGCHPAPTPFNAPFSFLVRHHVDAGEGTVIPLSIQAMEGPRARNFQQVVFAILWTLPILLALYVVWKHTVAFPFWDEWNTPGAQLASWYRGTLTFAELCGQHN